MCVKPMENMCAVRHLKGHCRKALRVMVRKMAKRDPLRPLRWTKSMNGIGYYTYRCSCGWEMEGQRSTTGQFSLTDPDYGPRRDYMDLQENARRLKRDHNRECPAAKKKR